MEDNSCKYATRTDNPWTRTCHCQCVVVECRNPKRVGKLQEKTDGARFFSIQLADEDYIRVRSYYCNMNTCFDYEDSE